MPLRPAEILERAKKHAQEVGAKLITDIEAELCKRYQGEGFSYGCGYGMRPYITDQVVKQVKEYWESEGYWVVDYDSGIRTDCPVLEPTFSLRPKK